MFDTAFNIMQAFQQSLWIAGGLFFWLIAGVMVLSHLHDRRTKKTYDGTIVALRMKGDAAKGQAVYYPVVSYRNEFGQEVEAETRSGSSAIANKIPGRAVKIMPDSHDPGVATIRDGSGLIIAFFMACIGAIPAAIGVTQYDVTVYTVLMFVLFGVWFAFKMARTIKPKAEWETREQFRARRTEKLRSGRTGLNRIDRGAAIDHLRAKDGLNIKFAPLTVLAALVFLGAAGWVAYDTGALIRAGATAAGTVAGLDRPDGSDVYHAIVTFKTRDGRDVTFTDRAGSSVPNLSAGQRVTVVYDPAKPHRAMIRDTGMSGAWIVVGASGGVGAVVLVCGLWGLAGALRRRENGYSSV